MYLLRKDDAHLMYMGTVVIIMLSLTTILGCTGKNLLFIPIISFDTTPYAPLDNPLPPLLRGIRGTFLS
jgi:hypothetical protein